MTQTPPAQYTIGTSPRRRKCIVFTLIGILFIISLSFRPVQQLSPVAGLLPVNDVDKNTDYPPSYEQLRLWEQSLPQHTPRLSSSEGERGRYVMFPERGKKLGWNNCLNEILMDSYLAYKSKRAFVFRDYVWAIKHYPWPIAKMRNWPPRTPLNALISGPTAGGPWREGDNAPRSVSEEYFNHMCPKSERRIINTRDIRPNTEANLDTAKTVLRTWEDILLNAPERCIEIQSPSVRHDDHWQVFGMSMWASDRILDLWEEFRDSPVSQYLETSPIVNAAIARNEYLFVSRGGGGITKNQNPYDRMMAIHIRRGDYTEQCLDLARWNSTFYGWNLLPFLLDKFVLPPRRPLGENSEENADAYLQRCLPDFDAVVEKIRTSRNDYIYSGKNTGEVTLSTLYILTNEDSEWLEHLKEALRGEDWNLIVTTRDLILDAEGVDTSMAIDMDIARRAAVFIGNGWSSMTSNIVHRRLVDGKDPISIRFY